MRRQIIVTLLLISLLSIVSFAGNEFDAGITITENDGIITVDIPTSNDPVLEEWEPILYIPYSGKAAKLEIAFGETVFVGTVEDGEVYFSVAKGGTYIIRENCENPDIGHNVHTWVDGKGDCGVCSQTISKEPEQPEFSISTVSVTLYNNLAINYKVDESLFTEFGYSDPYMVFEFNGKETVVDGYTASAGKYVFAFTDIAPNMMGDTVYGTLYATYNGEVVKSKTVGYSIKEYCDAVLENYTGAAYAELRTMLVDLLNYGAASQVFSGYNADTLVNASLSDALKAEGSQQLPELENVLTGGYEKIDNPTVSWTGVGLLLNDSITMRFKIDAADVEGMSLKVSGGGYNWTIDSGKFIATNGGYYVYFNGFNAYQVREHIYVTVYKNGEPVSNTLRYSVESYAQSQQNNTAQPQLAALVDAMMKYGISAYNYIH